MNKQILTQIIAICQAVYTANYERMQTAGYTNVSTLSDILKLIDKELFRFDYNDVVHTITVDGFTCQIKESSCFDVLKSFSKIEKLPTKFEFSVPVPVEQKIDLKKLYKFADTKDFIRENMRAIHYSETNNYIYCTDGHIVKAVKSTVLENKVTDIYGKKLSYKPLNVDFLLPENNQLYKLNLPDSIKKTLKNNINSEKVTLTIKKDEISLYFPDFEVLSTYKIKNDVTGELVYTTKKLLQVLSEKGVIYITEKRYLYVVDGLNFALTTCYVDSCINYDSLNTAEKYVHDYTYTDEHRASTDEHRTITDEHMVPTDEHRTITDEHMVPTNEHMVPTDEHMVPTNEHMVPTNEHMVPTDEHMVPTDEHRTITDEHMVPTNEHMVPTNEHMVPTDEHRTITDEHMVPTNEHMVPTDEHRTEIDIGLLLLSLHYDSRHIPPEKKNLSWSGIPPRKKNLSWSGIPPEKKNLSWSGIPPEKKKSNNQLNH